MAKSVLLIGWYRSLYPGLRVGRGVRLGHGVYISVVRGGLLTIADNVSIERHCQLIVEGSLSIGSGGFIGTGSIIVAADRVAIGNDVLVAAYATIRDQDHMIDGGVGPYSGRRLVTAPIEIGDNVWIGTKASVLRGTTIGDDAVIAAHALVNSSVEPGTIVGGVPAKVLKRLRRNAKE